MNGRELTRFERVVVIFFATTSIGFLVKFNWLTSTDSRWCNLLISLIVLYLWKTVACAIAPSAGYELRRSFYKILSIIKSSVGLFANLKGAKGLSFGVQCEKCNKPLAKENRD